MRAAPGPSSHAITSATWAAVCTPPSGYWRPAASGLAHRIELEHAGGHRCVGHAGGHRVDAQALRGVGGGRAAHQRLDAALRRRDRLVVGHADARHHRAGKHRRARLCICPALAAQGFDPRGQHEEGAVEVDAQHLAVLLGPGAVEWRDQGAADAMGEQGRACAERFVAGRQRPRRTLGRGGVGSDVQVGGNIGKRCGVTADHGDAVAGSAQQGRQLAADAAARTGDQGNRRWVHQIALVLRAALRSLLGQPGVLIARSFDLGELPGWRRAHPAPPARPLQVPARASR